MLVSSTLSSPLPAPSCLLVPQPSTHARKISTQRAAAPAVAAAHAQRPLASARRPMKAVRVSPPAQCAARMPTLRVRCVVLANWLAGFMTAPQYLPNNAALCCWVAGCMQYRTALTRIPQSAPCTRQLERSFPTLWPHICRLPGPRESKPQYLIEAPHVLWLPPWPHLFAGLLLLLAVQILHKVSPTWTTGPRPASGMLSRLPLSSPCCAVLCCLLCWLLAGANEL